MSARYDRRNVTRLVVHYLGDGKPPVKTKEEMFKRGNPYNYSYPEYDFGILADGTVVTLRPLTYIGAHTVSDIPSMQNGEKNWWNKNSASIVLGVGNGYKPTDAQIKSLANFVQEWMKKSPHHKVYKHSDITRTVCPNLSSDVWDSLFKEEEYEMDKLIICNDGDLASAVLAMYKHQAPVIVRAFAPQSLLDSAKHKIWIGISGTNDANNTYIAMPNRVETAKEVLK